MITQWFLDFFTGLVRPLIDALPSGGLSLPDISPVMTVVDNVDSLVPVGPLIVLALLLLACLVAFLAVRAVTFVVQLF